MNVFSLSLSEHLIALYSLSHLKKALYGLSTEFPNCQHHHPCALGPRLSKIRVAEHTPCDTTTADLLRDWRADGTHGRNTSDNGVVHVPGRRGTAQAFLALLTTARNLKLVHCSLEFSLHLFRPWLIPGNGNCRKRNYR